MPYGSGYLVTNYKADMAIVATRFQRFWLGVLVVLLIAFPFVAGPYYVHLINLVALACIAALGLHILTGLTGLISLGHAAFLAIGGFTAAILASELGLPFYVTVPAAMIAGAVAGLIAGLPVLRLRGFYVVLSTLAVHFIVTFAAMSYQSEGGMTAGYTIPAASLGPWVINTLVDWYFLLVAVVIAATVFCINLERSQIGRAWIAIREKDIVAEALGIHVGYYKLLSFMFSSALASLAGCLSSFYMHFVDASSYNLWIGIVYIAMIIIGGMGSIMGVFLGTILVTLLPYGLSMIFDLFAVTGGKGPIFFGIQYGLFGVLFVTFLVVEPEGLVGIWRRIRSFFELWPFKYKRVIATR